MATNTINKDRYNALRSALENLFENVQIQNCGKWGNTIEWKINWWAIGSTTPEVTMKMSKDLATAAKITEFLNSLNLILVWEDDEEISALAQKDLAEAEKYYNTLVHVIGECLRWNQYDALAKIVTL